MRRKIDAEKIKDKYAYELGRLSDILESINADTAIAYSIVSRHRKKSVEEVNAHPHLLTLYGADFKDVESIQGLHGLQYDEIRISALIRSVYDAEIMTGSTVVELGKLVLGCWRLEEKAGVYKDTPVVVLGNTLEKEYETFRSSDDGHIYVISPYIRVMEERVDRDVRTTLKKGPRCSVTSEIVKEVEQELGIEYDETQKEAFSLLGEGISILTGGPGTGKTAVLKGIIRAHEKLRDAPVVLCCPTGKGARVMREATGREAQTIHKTLCIYPGGSGYDLGEELPRGALVIVDEFSMIDLALMEVLMIAVAHSGTQIIFVGDEDQLPSVRYGNIAHDLIACGKIKVCRLETIHRQNPNCAIVKNAAKIRIGDLGLYTDTGKEFRTFREKQFFDEMEMARVAMGIFIKNFSGDVDAVKIITPVKDPKYGCSTQRLNCSLHCYYHQGEEEINGISVGDPIIITRNIHGLGLLNGDGGICVSLENGLTVRIDGKDYTLTGEDIQSVDLAYAITCHKSQGSSIDKAIVLVPQEPRCMLTRRMLYVAVTRAREVCLVLHQGDAWDTAIRNEQEVTRKTGLLERLEK